MHIRDKGSHIGGVDVFHFAADGRTTVHFLQWRERTPVKTPWEVSLFRHVHTHGVGLVLAWPWSKPRELKFGVFENLDFDGVGHGARALANSYAPLVRSRSCERRVKHEVGRNPFSEPTGTFLVSDEPNGVVHAKNGVRQDRGCGLDDMDGDGVLVDASIAVHHSPDPFEVAQARRCERPNAVDPRALVLNARPIGPNLQRQVVARSYTRPSALCGMAA